MAQCKATAQSGDRCKNNAGDNEVCWRHEEKKLAGAAVGGAVGGVIGALVGGPLGAGIGAAISAPIGHWIEGRWRSRPQ